MIKVLGKRVLVKPAEAESKSPGGIIIPDAAQEKIAEGVVIDVGHEVKDIQPNDIVFYGKYAGTTIKESSNSPEFLVMSEDEIFGIKIAKEEEKVDG